MQKITFAFPDHDSLWQFRNQTQAINVAITPKKNIISGLFLQHEVELAVGKFNAVTVDKIISSSIEKDNPGQTIPYWLKKYSIGYMVGVKKMKKVVSSIQSMKLF